MFGHILEVFLPEVSPDSMVSIFRDKELRELGVLSALWGTRVPRSTERTPSSLSSLPSEGAGHGVWQNFRKKNLKNAAKQPKKFTTTTSWLREHMKGRHLLVASVISVQNSNFVYPSCQNCFSKLLLDSKRYSCFKCGSSGDTKEANYRYRLSLEVADVRGIFEVTVFGSCLDAYFGVTAKELRRYIEDLNHETGEPDQDGTPSVVFQAVETCFIGKKFIFAVKGFGRADGTSSRYPKALVACQMLVPDLELMGDPVIRYLQQHPHSHSKRGHRSLWPPNLFAAFDEPSGETSSIQASGDLNAPPSSPTSGISHFWPRSFGLACSSTSSATAADLADLISSTTACGEQKWEINSVSLPGHNSRDPNLTRAKRNEEKGKKCHLWNHAQNEPGSYSSLGGKDCQWAQPLLKLTERGSSCKIVAQPTYGLQHSRSPLPHNSFGSLASSSGFPRADGNSQEDPGLWDDLPSSESLNEFIAKMENNSTLASKAEAEKHFPKSGTEELGGTPSPKPGIGSASFRTRQTKEKPQEQGDEVEKHAEHLLPHHQSSLLLYHSEDDSRQEALHSFLSMEGSKELGSLSKQRSILLAPCSPKGVGLPPSQGSRLSPKGILGQDVGSSTKHHAGCTSETTLEDSGLRARKTTAHLSCKDHGHLAGEAREEGPSCTLDPTTDLTSIQGEGRPSANGKKFGESCERKRGLLFEAHESSFGVNQGGWMRDRSNYPKSSYNASADLFDSHRGAEASGRELNSAREELVQEGPQGHSVTKEHIRLEPIPHELDASWTNSERGLSPCNRSPLSDHKTSTPVSGFTPTSKLSLMDSLDFIPHSQSTPLARPPLQASRPRGKESILRGLPPKMSRFNAKCKKLRPPLGNPSIKQLASTFWKCQRSKTVSSIVLDQNASHQSFLHSSLLQDVPANAGGDWVPLSEKGWTRPLPFPKRLMSKSLGRNDDDGQDRLPPFSEGKLRWATSASSSQLIMVELSPKSQPRAETKGGIQPLCQNDASSRQLVDGSGLNLAASSHPAPATPNWSPELF